MNDFLIVIHEPDQLGGYYAPGFDQLGMNYRRLQISGTVYLSAGEDNSFITVKNRLAPLFTNQGWQIINFDLTRASGFWGTTLNVNLIVNVPDQYTNQQHLDQAYLIFSTYKEQGQWGFDGYFSDVRLTATGQDKAGYTAPPITTTGNQTPTPPPAGASQADIDKYNAALAATGKDKDILTQIYDSLNPTKLFGTTGVTIGAVAGILFLVVVFKRG